MQIKLRPHQERGDVAMQQHNLGQLIYPTGGGKTLNMIMDAVRQFQSTTPQTIVVVAPRILLAEQLSSEFLEFITNAAVFHCHSGDVQQITNLRQVNSNSGGSSFSSGDSGGLLLLAGIGVILYLLVSYWYIAVPIAAILTALAIYGSSD